MNANAIVILLCLWAGLCIALPLWGQKVSPQGRIALPLLAMFAIWFGATLPLEPHGPGFAFAALLSFPLGWIGHWLFPFPGSNTLAVAFVLIAAALSAVLNFYLLAWVLTATCRRLGGMGLRLRGQWLCGIIAVLSGCASVNHVPTDDRIAGCPDALHYKSSAHPEFHMTAYDVEDGWIIKRLYSWREPPGVQARRKPTAVEWARFGRVLDDLRLWEWNKFYAPEDLGHRIYDGHSWAFSCRVGAHPADVRGRNAYPTYGDPQQTTRDANTFRRLTEALERLVNPQHERREDP